MLNTLSGVKDVLNRNVNPYTNKNQYKPPTLATAILLC